jgi:hypothetical protein
MYAAETATRICIEISAGRSLRSICADEGMPDKATVFRWLAEHGDFRDQYARAREAQADAMLEEIIEISDDGSNDTYTDENGATRTEQDVIARSRLRVDARKWAMSKMAPKKYGDKLDIDQKTTIGATDPLLALMERIAGDGKRLGRRTDLPESGDAPPSGRNDFASEREIEG